MIRTITLRSWEYLWRFSLFRWSCFHGPVGLTNYSLAFVLFWLYGVDKYIATSCGHAVHVFCGYFYDRSITFRKVTTDRFRTWIRYWVTESLSYLSILMVMYAFITLLRFNLCGFDLLEFDLCGPKTAASVIRIGPAMVVASLISFFGHKHWTFAKANSWNTPP